MSILGRLGKIGSGVGDFFQAPAGLIWDLGSAWARDDPELDGFFHTLVGRTTNRGAQLLSGAFGPEGAIGSTIGALAPEIRDPVGSVVHPVLEGSRWGYTNAISHPLATLIKVGSLTESEIWREQQGTNEWSAFIDPDSWSKAWRMTKHQSPGQALAENLNFAFLPMISEDLLRHPMGGKDILDLGEINKFEGTDFYAAASGITDAALSWEYDPLNFLGITAGAARKARVVRPLREGLIARERAVRGAVRAGATADEAIEIGVDAYNVAHSEQIARYFLRPRWEKLEGELGRINDLYPSIDTRVGAIRKQLFPDHAQGYDIAVVMSRATTTAEREAAMRVLMGENTATQLLRETNGELAEAMRASFEDSAMIHDTLFDRTYHDSPSYRPDVNPGAQVDAVKEAFDVGSRLEGIHAAIKFEQRIPGKWARTKNTEFYQTSAYTKPVRVFTNITSTNIVDPIDPQHIDQVERALRRAGLDEAERITWQGKIANASPEERMAVVIEAETAAIKKLADKHGVDPNDLKEILGGGNAHRDAAMKILLEAPVDAKGRAQIRLNLDDELIEYSANIPNPESAYLLTDMRELDKALEQWTSLRGRLGLAGATKMPREYMNKVMQVWRAGVLLRPAWPVRVVGENGLAMMAKLEDLSMGIPALRQMVKDYAPWKAGFHNVFHDISEQLGLGWGGGTGALFGGLVAGPFGVGVGGAAGYGLQKWGRSLEEIPFHQFQLGGYTAHVPFGSPLDKEAVFRQLSSGRASIEAALGRKPGDPRMIVTPKIASSRPLTPEEHAAAIDEYMETHYGGEYDEVANIVPSMHSSYINRVDHDLPPIREVVSIDKVVSIQDEISRAILTPKIADPQLGGVGGGPIEAIKVGDHYMVYDGNHRLNAAIARGETTLEMDVRPFDPVPDQAKFEGRTVSQEEQLANTAQVEAEIQQMLADKAPYPRPIPKTVEVRADPADFVSYAPGHSMYPEQWEKAVNEEIALDPLARIILAHDHGIGTYTPAGFSKEAPAGMSGDEVGRLWLQHTPEGRKHVAETPIRSGDLDEWTKSMQEMVHDLTAGDPVIAARIINMEQPRPLTPAEYGDAIDAHIAANWEKFRDPKTGSTQLIPTPRIKLDDLMTQSERNLMEAGDPTYVDANVPVNRIVGDQEAVSLDMVLEYAHSIKTEIPEAIDVIQVGDYYMLWDGNHRVNAALLTGEATIEANIWVPDLGVAKSVEFRAAAEEAIANRVKMPTVPTHTQPTRITHDDLERAVGTHRIRPMPEGYTDQAFDIPRDHWESPPEEGSSLYHASIDVPGVMDEGLRGDLTDRGLGGPNTYEDSISLSSDLEHAQQIADYLRIAQNASTNGTHLSVLQGMDNATGFISEVGVPRIVEVLRLRAREEGYTVGTFFPDHGRELGGYAPERLASIPIAATWRNPVTHKFQAIKTIEDLALYVESLGMTPLETLQWMDGVLLNVSFEGGTPGYNWIGPFGDEATYRGLNPAKIGVVKVGVRREAEPTGSGTWHEIQMDPADTHVIQSMSKHGIPNPEGMPVVHPEYAKQVTGTSERLRGIRGVTEQLFKALGSIPIDDLVNHRFFAQVYRLEMERRTAGLHASQMTDGFMAKIEESARGTALQEMRHLMDDFTHRSEFADAMRLVMPFFPAWQETLQRWTGLALENPSFIRRATQVFEAPGKMGVNWTDPTTGEEYVRLRVPEFARSLLGHGYLGKALDDQGYIRFQASGLSMAGQGLPGFGPWVDVALHPFVKSHPELIPAMRMVYPFGSAPDTAIQAFLPPTYQRLTAINDDDARSFRATYNRIILTRLTKMSTGELPKLNLDDPLIRSQFLDDAHTEAQQLAGLRLVVGMFAPAAIQYDTPFQPLMDKYRELIAEDPANAQEKFLDLYGEEFFHLTQAFTKLNNGIPATLEGDAAYQKYQDMVQRFPELGGLIMGEEGGGSAAQFMAAIYQKQRTTPIRPGSDVMMRTPLSPEEIVMQDNARLGWIKFTRAMDLIDSEMAQAGIVNLNTKEGAQLRFLKDGIISGIANDHPQWFQEYSDRNDVKWDNKIAAMGEIAADTRLKNRPDIEMLGEYLQARAMIMGELAARESSSLDSLSNIDLRAVWDSIVQGMKNGDNGLAFSSLYNRWLIHDPLSSVGINTLGIENASYAA